MRDIGVTGVQTCALPISGQRLPARPHARGDVHAPGEGPLRLLQGPTGLAVPDPDQVPRRGAAPGGALPRSRVHDRSEEHTSELQSCQYLVCRLLLEKKKKQKMMEN